MSTKSCRKKGVHSSDSIMLWRKGLNAYCVMSPPPVGKGVAVQMNTLPLHTLNRTRKRRYPKLRMFPVQYSG